MPRNKSEKLPRVPLAIAYADACEAVLKNEAIPAVALDAWNRLHSAHIPVATAVDRHARVGDRNWRSRRVAFIRTHYAA